MGVVIEVQVPSLRDENRYAYYPLSEELSTQQILKSTRGLEALAAFNADSSLSDSDTIVVSARSVAKRRARDPDFVDTEEAIAEIDDDIEFAPNSSKGGHLTLRTSSPATLKRRQQLSSLNDSGSLEGSSQDEVPAHFARSDQQSRLRVSLARQRRTGYGEDIANTSDDVLDDDEVESENNFRSASDDDHVRSLRSDVRSSKRRKLQSRTSYAPKGDSGGSSRVVNGHAERRSDRVTRNLQNMQERIEDEEMYRSDSEPKAPPRAIGVKEIFKVLPRNDEFRRRHCPSCDTCSGVDNSTTLGPLIHCQGCTLSYHKNCLGNRTSRDHLVTKVGDKDSILQCRRCIAAVRRKEPTAPDQGKCEVCKEHGPSCIPYREKKTAQQEEKEREANGGEDPIVPVTATLINNMDNVLFRCTNCWRAFHFHHLPSRILDTGMDFHEDDQSAAETRFREYCRDWKCKDCVDMPAKVSGLIAWRPVNEDAYQPGRTNEQVDEDEKEYLIKYEHLSYLQSCWMPGAWTWGVTTYAMRRAFAKREGCQLPKMSTEDAIPEEWLRIDIVLDVQYTSFVDIRTEDIDKARIREVKQALIKYKGLGYEDAVWEKVPTPDEGDRWVDFVTAYNDWVLGRYVQVPKPGLKRVRLEALRSQQSFNKLELKQQPDNLVGGELMNYQLEGLNWLYYRWFTQNNAILADEMGLGKTIQIIGFLATLVQSHNCFPFLVVVPNSTCANWRREIKQWAPSLRVVTYFGTAAARDIALKYELYPGGSKDLKCHIVVTSYETAADESCQKFFRHVSWAGMIVDEGQRLKNDRNLLYAALGALKVPFRVLLTGTPLQNNPRELFNLLQFLDPSIDAAALDLEFTDNLTKENVARLHEMIRPYFLRRTKAQVLTFLPPMAQIVVPVSMSLVQKELYKRILSKNPELLRALFKTGHNLTKGERANLNNLLMQLRKCLCHPFVYSKDIEERQLPAAVSHRNLVDASGKLQLLELLLPKLKERGHRVLIFSQFLDMLDIVEDFLDGLELKFQRLDGSISSLQKQKRIDAFNAEDSPYFAFLLSTRAGGVGINLATADTVIILDPDFNPHQDIQALSRAHRIGQKKKVLCFQLMTRQSAEEKIVQTGRRKMALDHVLIEKMDTDDEVGVDLETVISHGISQLFANDEGQDVRYDEAAVEKLLDRSQMENTRTDQNNSAESQFSFARVWANDHATLEDSLQNSEVEDRAPDPSVWENILKERERAAAEEATRRARDLGRGKRARQIVNYGVDVPTAADGSSSPVKGRKDRKTGSDSDTDFLDHVGAGDQSPDEVLDDFEALDLAADRPETAIRGLAALPPHVPAPPLTSPPKSTAPSIATAPQLNGPSQPLLTPTPTMPPLPTYSANQAQHVSFENGATNGAPVPTHNAPTGHVKTTHAVLHPKPGAFSEPGARSIKRAVVPSIGKINSSYQALLAARAAYAQAWSLPPMVHQCLACGQGHPIGSCPLKIAGPEHCPICGIAHYGVARTCPHIQSETQVRAMLEALKHSSESKHLKEEAKKYLTGVKGTIVQQKKKKDQRAKEKQRPIAPNAPPMGGRAPVSNVDGTADGNAQLSLDRHTTQQDIEHIEPRIRFFDGDHGRQAELAQTYRQRS